MHDSLFHCEDTVPLPTLGCHLSVIMNLQNQTRYMWLVALSILPCPGAVDESISMYREGLQIMEGCSKFRDDDPSLETVRTDLAELLNTIER